MKYNYGDILKSTVKTFNIKITSVDTQNKSYEIEIDGVKLNVPEYILDLLVSIEIPKVIEHTIEQTINKLIEKAVKEPVKKLIKKNSKVSKKINKKR